MNRDWTSHVKKYAFRHNITYMEALKSLECQESYQKKERKYEGIKELREKQNNLVMNYFDNIIGREEFQRAYVEIEQKIKQKSDDLRRYRGKPHKARALYNHNRNDGGSQT